MGRLNIGGEDDCDSPEVRGDMCRDEGLGEGLDLEGRTGVGLCNDELSSESSNKLTTDRVRARVWCFGAIRGN
jgi:hypothetical protein